MTPPASPSVSTYTLAMEPPSSRMLCITWEWQRPFQADNVAIYLPNWIPGSYKIRDFSRCISHMHAQSDQGYACPIVKRGKNYWEIDCAAVPPHCRIAVSYRVFADDLSVRGAHLDDTHAYFNGAPIFLYAEHTANQPADLVLLPVHFPAVPHPQVYTTLPATQIDSQGFGRYTARDYQDLIDHPVEMGQATCLHFTLNVQNQRIVHRIAVSHLPQAWEHQPFWDWPRLQTDVQKICETHAKLFGHEAPMDRYLFLLHTQEHSYGGLEHQTSSSLMANWSDLPVQTQANTDPQPTATGGYENLLGLFSHEYLHSWLVKRLFPAAFDTRRRSLAALHQEAYTEELWIYEGITSYYDHLALVRAKCISLDTYLIHLGQLFTRLYRQKGRLHQSVAASSFDAWISLYQPHAYSPNLQCSYYLKGALLALWTDWRIRYHTQSEKSLDTVLRSIWQQYRAGEEAVPAQAWFQAIVDTTPHADPAFWDDFWKAYLYGTEDWPLDDWSPWWEQMGLTWHWRPAEGPDDKGGTPPGASAPLGWIGLTGTLESSGYRVQTVITDSPAEKAGICPDDIFIAYGSRRIQHANWQTSWLRANCAMSVHFFRRDTLHTRTIMPIQPPLDTVYFTAADPQNNPHLQAWITQESAGNTGPLL